MEVLPISSGSDGNAYVVRSAGATVLVEAGLAPATLLRRLRERAIQPETLDGVLVSHEHIDHVRAARHLGERLDLPVYCTPGTAAGADLADLPRLERVPIGRPFDIKGLGVETVATPHDANEPVAFRFDDGHHRAMIATDLGFVPDAVQAWLRDLDLLIIEANHDEAMMWNGPYPEFLKRRLASRVGHLSNDACARALVACGDRVPGRVWLAHLSETNNTAHLALRHVGDRLAEAGLGHVELVAIEGAACHELEFSDPRERQMRLL
jgi:phosphoribosyl 1,2-cyclic phosphodiesterase